MYLKQIVIKNIGPISELNIELPFNENGNPKPIILVGENGTGKTIMLSQVIDSFYEIGGSVFDNIKISKGMGHKYFKVSGGGNMQIGKDKGFSALQFKEGEDKIEYLDKSGDITDEIKTYISNFEIIPETKENKKQITSLNDSNKKTLENSWLNGVYFYQPAYRYEEPFWKVDDFKKKVLFEDHQRYSGKLEKEIEIISSLNKNKSFLMDLVLDQQLSHKDESHRLLWSNIDIILKDVMQSNVAFAIGSRGTTRVVIGNINEEGSITSSISVDNLSLGESVLLNFFINIIRHSCQYQSKPLNEIIGIVAIDEIDIHLHTNLQSKVLPKLIKLFPKVQFIITSHSPLFLLGMEREFEKDGVEIRNMPKGELITTERFVEFENAYKVLKKTETYEDEIKEQIRNSNKPLVFVEGDYDIKYFKKASELLNKKDLIEKIDFINADGYQNLNKIWKHNTSLLEAISQKMLLLYDCDTKTTENAKGKIFKRIIPYMEENHFDRGIENLFPKITIEKVMKHKKDFIDYTSKVKRTVRGKKEVAPEKFDINPDEKGNLCNWLCQSGTKEDFIHFDKVFKIFEEFLFEN